MIPNLIAKAYNTQSVAHFYSALALR